MTATTIPADSRYEPVFCAVKHAKDGDGSVQTEIGGQNVLCPYFEQYRFKNRDEAKCLAGENVQRCARSNQTIVQLTTSQIKDRKKGLI